ncbi:MAG: hypothetical protein WC291_04605 [Thermodesulfovibrionales bacterium]|jgi:hypothetical protein
MDPDSLFASAKVAYDIAKGILSLKTEVERNESIAKLLETLLSVQGDALLLQKEYHALLTEKKDLEEKLKTYDRWEETKALYVLKEVAPGVFVYAYETAKNSTTPAHLICPNCYMNRKASILQVLTESVYGKTLFCPNCAMKLSIRSNNPPSESISAEAWT